MSELMKLSFTENNDERNIVYKKQIRKLLSSGKYSWKRRVFSLAMTLIFIFISLQYRSLSSMFLFLIVVGIFDLYRLVSLPFVIKKLYKKPSEEGLRTFELLEDKFCYEVGNTSVKFDYSQIESITKIEQFVLISLNEKKINAIPIYSNAFKSISCDDFLKVLKDKLQSKIDDKLANNLDLIPSCPSPR